MLLGLSGGEFLALVIVLQVAIVAGAGILVYVTCSIPHEPIHARRDDARTKGARHHAIPAPRVREAQGQGDEQEVSRAYRQRWQDQDWA